MAKNEVVMFYHKYNGKRLPIYAENIKYAIGSIGSYTVSDNDIIFRYQQLTNNAVDMVLAEYIVWASINSNVLGFISIANELLKTELTGLGLTLDDIGVVLEKFTTNLNKLSIPAGSFIVGWVDNNLLVSKAPK